MAGRILKPSEETVSAVSSILHEGGIILYPSDTVYGLLTHGFSRDACIRLSILKGYTSPRPFIILTESIDDALKLTSGTNCVQFMEKYWPGPVTLILPASADAPEWLVGETGGVAVRIPADPLSRAILSATSMKLVSTSANLAGGPTPRNLEDVPDAIKEIVDAVIDGGQTVAGQPSAIIDLTGSSPTILR